MNTKLKIYDRIRSMSDKEYDVLRKLLVGTKSEFIDYIEYFGRWAIAALLAYVAYDYFDHYESIMGWATAISAGALSLGKAINGYIGSIIYSINILKNKKYDDALDMADMVSDMRKKDIQNKINRLEELENEQ